MKVAWVHNFPPDVTSAGVFMNVLAEEVTRQGCEPLLVYTGPLRRPDQILLAPGRLKRAAGGCDVIHAQYGSGCGYVASKLPGPKVLTLRGSDWYGVPSTTLKNRLHGAACQCLTRISLLRYDAVVVMSERMKRDVLARRRGTSVDVLPDGIDMERFQPMDRSEARRRLGFPDDEAPWVLFSTIRTGTPVKRTPLARAAFETLRKQVPEAELKVLTGVPHNQVPLWVNASDVVLLTSAHEGWPNIIKESLACNVPFVSTDVSDLRQIADAERNCFVADPTPEALANCLAMSLRHERTDTLRHHVKPLAVGSIARRLVKLYETEMRAWSGEPAE